ncbi:MAG: ABC transporter ATP-binding protein [Lachnospiraceae bacterium]|nr:ABC transporter ATP-binding protein [Lachnospiraceae bacterium]
MIEVKNMVKRYGLIPAVDDISFTLHPGKIYGFLGPNGAGKSTTMNMMTGYIAPTSGDILINDFSIMEDPEEAKSYIGYLPEIPPVYPDMTVEEYLRFVTELKGVKRSERKDQINMAINRTRLNEYRHRLIRNLSKGYRQRVGLAQALLGHPQFIILDEPTVGLDPKQILEIRALIRELAISDDDVPAEERPIVLLSSHIMQEVSAVCDEILIIAHGRLIVMDTPENLITRYHTRDVYEIEARTTEENLGEVLAPFKGMAEFEFDSNDMPEGVSKVRLMFEKGADVAELLFKTLAKAGIPVRQFKNVVPTLEDIFLRLVAKADEEYAQREEERMRDDNAETEASENFTVTPEEPTEEPETEEAEAEDAEAEDAESDDAAEDAGADAGEDAKGGEES